MSTELRVDGTRRRLDLAERAAVRLADVRAHVRWRRLDADHREEIVGRSALKVTGSGLPWSPRTVALREAVAWGRSEIYEQRAGLRRRTRVVGLEDVPRRAVFCAMHCTSMWIALYGVAMRGTALHVVVEDWFWNSPLADQRRAVVEAGGGSVVRRDDALALLPPAVARGERPVLLLDVPGSCPVPLLGKTARIRRGAARLAHATGAALVPVGSGWHGTTPVATIGAPQRPDADADRAMRDIVAALEAPLRERPEDLLVYTPDLWPEEGATMRWAFPDVDPAPDAPVAGHALADPTA